MLDGGKAKDKQRDPNIKHVTHFEPRVICKLLNSPDYLGRAYSRVHKDPTKYIKNKQICDLIDEIRYNTGSKGEMYARKHSAKLHYRGIVPANINGGNASALYEFADQLDLGDAGPDQNERLLPRIIKPEDTNALEELEYRRDNSAKLNYKDYLEPRLNGGNASSSYETADKLDLGGAGPKCGEVLVPHLGHIH
jgi:hypothetical protein